MITPKKILDEQDFVSNFYIQTPDIQVVPLRALETYFSNLSILDLLIEEAKTTKKTELLEKIIELYQIYERKQ